jgi:hypothetical protein
LVSICELQESFVHHTVQSCELIMQTWSCVPNSYRVPLLAPIYNEGICPHPAERWEVRTHPFGCNVSTTTSLTAVVSVAATLALTLIVLLTIVAIRRVHQFSKRNPNWRRIWGINRWTNSSPHERDPLIPERGRSSADGA